MSETKPIPQAILLPEEREALQASGQPKLEGSPRDETESALLSIPEYATVANDLIDFDQQTKSEQRQILQRERVRRFLQRPQTLPGYFDTLENIKAGWTNKQGLVSNFENLFAQNFDKYVERVLSYSPASLSEWLNILVHSEVYKPYAERIIKTLAQKAETPEQTTNLLYAFGEAVISAQDPQVFKEGLRILCCATPLFDERIRKNFILASLQGNDNLLQRQQEVDSLLYCFAQTETPEAYAQMLQRGKQISEDEEMLSAMGALYARGKQRADILIDFLERSPGEAVSLKEWPYSLIIKAGPLRAKVNERIAEQNENVYNLIWINRLNMAYPNSNARIIRVQIIDLLKQKSRTDHPVTEGAIIKNLFYLTPELSHEQSQRLVEDNIELRKSIIRDEIHSLSPRGDKMLIVDEELKRFQLKSILFEVGEPVDKTKVTIEAGEYSFTLQLNESLLMETVTGDQDFHATAERRAFFEQMVLAHLYELQCSERTIVGKGDVGKSAQDAQTERQKEFTSRRAYLPKLSPGRGFTERARLLALQNKPRPYDLIRINKELGYTKETGQKTYVPPTEQVKIGNQEPVISRAPKAMERYKRIIQNPKE